jgi:hypothetical protein
MQWKDLLTTSKEQISFWEGNNYLASQVTPNILWIVKVDICVYKSAPLFPDQSQINPVQGLLLLLEDTY